MIHEENLPKGWKIAFLEELVRKKITDGVHKTPKYTNSGIPFITAKDINKESIDFSDAKYITKEEHEKLIKRCNPEKNDVLLSKVGTLGKVAKIETSIDFSIFVQLALIKPKFDLIDSDYLIFILKTPFVQNQIISKSNKSTMGYIGTGKIAKLKIILPPLKTQKKIVEVLEKTEKLKEWRAEADELADKYLNSIFIAKFGNVYKNPYKFKMCFLGEICSFSMGGTPDPNKSDYYDGNILWAKGSDISQEYIYDVKNRISNSGLENSRAQIYPTGTVLIGRTGQGKTRGTTGILRVEASTNETMIGINPEFSIVTAEYLHFNLKFRYKELRDIGGDNARGGITQKNLKKLKIVLPPIELQNQFADIVQHVESLKTYQSQSKQQIDNLFNTLMQKAFKGELVC